MTDMKVGTGFGTLLNKMGSGKATKEETAQEAKFMISLQKASVSEVGNKTQSYTDYQSQYDSDSIARNDTKQVRQPQQAQQTDSSPKDNVQQTETAANQGQVSTDNSQTAANGNTEITDSQIEAAIKEITGEQPSETMLQHAKKFLENLKSDVNLQEKLKNMLAQAIHNAFQKLQDPEEQEEEFTKKVLEFLEKLLEGMNGGKDKKNPFESGNADGTVEGVLMQMLANMVRQMQGEYGESDTACAVTVENKIVTAVGAAVQVDVYENVTVPQISAAAETVSNSDKLVQTSVPETSAAEAVTSKLAADGFEVPAETTVLDDAAYEQIAKEVYTEVYAEAHTEVSVQMNAAASVTVQKAEIVGEPVDSVALNRIRAAVASKSENSGNELEELKRLFGLEPKKVKQKPEENEEKEESSEETEDNTQNQTTASSKQVKSAETQDISKFSEKLGVESITATNKTETAAVARAFTLGEAGVKQVLSQVVTETLNNLPQEQGEKSFMMTLNPETLGRITVRMVENAGKMEIIVAAHNKDTADLLASRLDGMESMMKQSGTQLEKCQVVYEPEQNDKAGQQNYEGSSKNPYFRQQNEKNTDKDGEFREALRQQAV